MNSFWLLYFFQFSCLNWVISIAFISLLKFPYVLKCCPYFPLEFLTLIKAILKKLYAISKPSVRVDSFVDLFLLTGMFFWFWVTSFYCYLFVLLFCVPVNFFKLYFYNCVGVGEKGTKECNVCCQRNECIATPFIYLYAGREHWVSLVVVELDGALVESGIEEFLAIISPLAPNILRRIKTFCSTG